MPESLPFSVPEIRISHLFYLSSREFLTTYGEGVADNAMFVIRWLPGVAVSDRITHGGKVWNIVALAEIGRRRGLELRAVAA